MIYWLASKESHLESPEENCQYVYCFLYGYIERASFAMGLKTLSLCGSVPGCSFLLPSVWAQKTIHSTYTKNFRLRANREEKTQGKFFPEVQVTAHRANLPKQSSHPPILWSCCSHFTHRDPAPTAEERWKELGARPLPLMAVCLLETMATTRELV